MPNENIAAVGGTSITDGKLPVKLAAGDQGDTRESWRISNQQDVTTNSSAKTFTVPADTEWQVFSVYANYATNATVGNRQLAVQVLDSSGNTILQGYRAGIVQAASLTRIYQFGGVPQDSAFRDTDYLGVQMPPLYLTAGQKLKVWDKAAIAALGTAENLLVYVQIASRSIA